MVRKNMLVYIPLVAYKTFEVDPLFYDTKREVVKVFEKVGKATKFDVSKEIAGIYTGKPVISTFDEDKDGIPESVLYYEPEIEDSEVVPKVSKLIQCFSKGATCYEMK